MMSTQRVTNQGFNGEFGTEHARQRLRHTPSLSRSGRLLPPKKVSPSGLR
jgi:hypothetical protein